MVLPKFYNSTKILFQIFCVEFSEIIFFVISLSIYFFNRIKISSVIKYYFSIFLVLQKLSKYIYGHNNFLKLKNTLIFANTSSKIKIRV